MNYLSVRNWGSFQQYKDRDPKWIKLHRSLLDDYEFNALPDETKAHLMGIWLLAAKLNNKIPADGDWIAMKIGAKSEVQLNELVTAQFLEPYSPVQNCTELYLEREERERQRQRETTPKPPSAAQAEPTPQPRSARATAREVEVASMSVSDIAENSPSLAQESKTYAGSGVGTCGGEKTPHRPAQRPEASDIIERWNALADQIGIAPFRAWTPKRRKVLAARLKEAGWTEHYREALEALKRSPFCQGLNDRGWKANIDWFLRPDTVTRLVEGRYRGPEIGFAGEMEPDVEW